ncbi:LacI family DNA-binding transcriptional regulator [Billgrantia ethanolica]|uniref:LacI family DNA-binding transcriptional regulator n=1 Tax=Billgrantia ethanolica TaxID=2733486 RepID=A0ABS9A021_9GAMM|nr:LacI family DNA-binding transcriptional regulator [Halomonas ethanolica]MCE8002189.1 LacI family DNA-binding transcriptional regulator [Halomonas ethanolica]
MKRRSVTSHEVARLAGVSQSAVSRCFSPHASISAETREKVLAAARQLGYRPNTIARSLITRSSRTVAVVVSQLDNPFYALTLARASRAFQSEGYHLLLFLVSDDGDTTGVMSEILQSQAEGILMLAASLTTPFAQECVARSIPVVMINRTVDFTGVSQVSSDNYHGGYWAGSYLAGQGHRRMAFLNGLASSSTGAHRRQGFLDALAAQGLECWAEENGEYRFDKAREATRRLFVQPPYPDAVFAANDHMAVAVIETLRAELGLRVPEDVSVIGFDDTPIAAWPSYRLTTIRQPLEDMVAAAAELLLEQMREERLSPVQRILPVVPILRGSVQQRY